MKKWLSLIIGLVLILGLSLWLWKNNWAAIHFVDEEDNFVAGEMMLENKSIYKDVFSHHQPVSYLISREFQRVKPLNSVFELVKDHRFLVVVWAISWWILICLKTGFPGIILGLSYEIIKYKYLGNLFLGESFSVYPLIYALVIVLEEKRNRWEMTIVGAALALAWCLVASNAIVVAVLGIYLFVKDKKRWWLILGGILISGLILSQLPLKEYWQNGILTNLKIYIPNTQGKTAFGWSLNIFWIVIAGLILLKIKKFNWIWWAVLVATGLRGVQLNNLYYGGFHFLPWIGICLTGVVLKNKKWGLVLILAAAILGNLPLLKSRDAIKDFEINYSEQRETREVINALKSGQDRLFVDPDEMLVYWKTANPLTQYIFYYPWMNVFGVNFENKKPEFWYHQDRKSELEKYLGDYVQIKRKGNETDLYLSKEKAKSLNPEQIKKMEYLGFGI